MANRLETERKQPLPLEVRPIQAVVLIIKSHEGVYTNRERLNKPELGKIAGMISPPMETIKREIGETQEQALVRLYTEEIAYNLITTPPKLIGCYGIGEATAWCYEAQVLSRNGRNPNYMTDELEDPNWVQPNELVDGVWVREGVPEMIMDYISGAKGVYRTSCRPALLAPDRLNGNIL